MRKLRSAYMWRSSKDNSPRADIEPGGISNLFAQLLYRNLYKAEECRAVLVRAQDAMCDRAGNHDWGNYDAIALRVNDGCVLLEHAIPAYGSLSLDLDEFVEVLKAWTSFVEQEEQNDARVILAD